MKTKTTKKIEVKKFNVIETKQLIKLKGGTGERDVVSQSLGPDYVTK